MTGIAVAIDLGGTQLRAALIDNVGTILARTVVPTAAMSGPEVVINQISDAIAEIP